MQGASDYESCIANYSKTFLLSNNAIIWNLRWLFWGNKNNPQDAQAEHNFDCSMSQLSTSVKKNLTLLSGQIPIFHQPRFFWNSRWFPFQNATFWGPKKKRVFGRYSWWTSNVSGGRRIKSPEPGSWLAHRRVSISCTTRTFCPDRRVTRMTNMHVACCLSYWMYTNYESYIKSF